MPENEQPEGQSPEEQEGQPEQPPADTQWNAPSLASGDPLAGSQPVPPPSPPPVGLGDTSSMATGPVPPPPVGLGDTSSMATGPVPPPPAAGGFPPPTQSPPWPASVAQSPPAMGAPMAPPSYALASWGSRVGAALIDGVLIMVLAFVLAIPLAGIVGATGSEGGAVAAFIGWFVLFFIAAALYAPVTMMRSGQTPGKKLVGIRVVRDDGQPMSFGFACFRELLVKGLLIGGVGSFLGGIPGIINVLWPLVDDQNRAFHDMIVKSHVVQA